MSEHAVTKMKKNYFWHVLSFLVLYGCAGSDNSHPIYSPSNLIKNGSMELLDSLPKIRPSFWRDSLIQIIQDEGYHFGVSDSVACCGVRSVFTECSKPESQNLAIWYQPISRALLPAGKGVRLSVSVKTQNLQGKGFEFGAMCKGSGMRDTFFTSQAWTTGLTGNRPWLEYIITFVVPQQTEHMEIWLALQTGSTGRVYFDKVELTLQ